MGKISTSESKVKARHNPLLKDVRDGFGTFRQARESTHEAGANEDAFFLDPNTSRKILRLAKEQQDDLDAEESELGPDLGLKHSQKADTLIGGDSSEEYSDMEVPDEVEIEELEVADENDLKYFENFLSGSGEGVNLADKIMAKIHEKELMKAVADQASRPETGVLLPPKVIIAYKKIGQILSTYTHGKLPKLFKVLPSLKNWEDVLFVTNPEGWTPHAVYEASKLFVSNLNANEAQKFIENVLLERFRMSIEDREDHTLDYHIYRALKKSLYKPGAFFKGFLLPLVDSHCNVREATIAASILAKVSIPALHSSVALAQLCQREFSPATTVFIRTLIEKKYALPYQTLDELVFYFMLFRDDKTSDSTESLNVLPVVWHKAFLAFVQRYKNDITDDQRDFLLETVRQRFHHAIGPEIRRELVSGVLRVEKQEGNKDSMMEQAF